MWDEPFNAIIAWLPLLPLMVVTLSLMIHLALFVWGSLTSNFAHLANWGIYTALAITLFVVTVLAGVSLPEFLVEKMGESSPELRFIWVVVAGVITTFFTAMVLVAEHFLGRMIYISGKDGTIRYYSPERLWPSPTENHLDLVKPLRFDGHSVDVWGMETLHANRHMPEGAIVKMVNRVNMYLPEIRHRGGR